MVSDLKFVRLTCLSCPIAEEAEGPWVVSVSENSLEQTILMHKALFHGGDVFNYQVEQMGEDEEL